MVQDVAGSSPVTHPTDARVAVPRAAGRYVRRVHRIFTTPFAAVYPLYVTKVERKGRSKAELDAVICWLTGFTAAQLQEQVDSGATFAEFFDAAPMSPDAALVTGVVCGVRVEEVEDPLMQQIRRLDKVVDELAKGKALSKVMRQA